MLAIHHRAVLPNNNIILIMEFNNKFILIMDFNNNFILIMEMKSLPRLHHAFSLLSCLLR